MNSNIVSQIMSKIPSRNRAYSLKQGIEMGDECFFLILDPRIHRTLPEEVYDLKNLISLTIEGIPLKKLPKGICGFKSLKILNILGCGTDEIPVGFNELNLEALFISHNNWEVIPEDILALKKLKSLSITDCQLKEIKLKENQLKNLEEINLSNNFLNKIDDNFYSILNLKKIDLSNNKIKEIKPQIKSLTNLKELKINFNSVHEIPKSINDLNRLNLLDLSNNKIKEINLFNLNMLSVLKLNNNKLTRLNNELFSLPISFLDISKNKITEIPASISHCRRLAHLDISSNETNELPIEINQLKQLHTFNTQKNNILAFPIGILGLDNIKKIKGWASFTDLKNRKYIIPFIHHSKKEGYTFEERKKLWLDFTNISTIRKPDLINLINSNFRPFKNAAIEKLITPNQTVEIKSIKEVYLTGKLKTKKTNLSTYLLKNDIAFTNKLSSETSHIVLGNGRYKSDIDKSWNGIFLSEISFLKIIKYEEKTDDLVFNNSTIENINKLLLSDDNNLELALQLLKNKNIPKEIITTLFFINISHENPSLRIKSRALIKSEKDLLIYSKKDFINEKRINQILNIITNINLNKKELSYLLFNKNNKAWSFIKNNYDENILLKIERKKILDLSNADLIKIPTEIKEINTFNKIDLSNNQLTSIDLEDIKLLDDFQEIILSNNPIIKIHPDLLQLKNLRILHLKNCKNIQEESLKTKAAWITIFK